MRLSSAFAVPQHRRIEDAPPDDNLVRIANIVDRSNLPARELLTILMRQHLELEMGSVGAAFWLQGGNFVQPDCGLTPKDRTRP